LVEQNIPSAGLAIMANCGHAINLEAFDEFNRLEGNSRRIELRPIIDRDFQHWQTVFRSSSTRR
jgi:hypothetical protein